MHASLIRRQLGTLIPPKVATPRSLVSSAIVTVIDHDMATLLTTRSQSGGSGAALAPLVAFYSKLPKGPAPSTSGLRGRYFEGVNVSGKPLAFTILAIFGLGYAIDYNSEFLFFPVTLLDALLIMIAFSSASKYVLICFSVFHRLMVHFHRTP